MNFPFSDDWEGVYAAIFFQQQNPLWIDTILQFGNEHLLIVYRILMMFIFSINSYNVIHINILSWGLLVSSLILLYHILKKTDSRLVWLIIPISALIFNPKVFTGTIVASYGLVWNITFFFVFCLITVFLKEKISKKWFFVAIIIATLSSFSSVLGTLSWLVGFLFLIKIQKENKHRIILWVFSASIISVFFYSLSSPNSVSTELSDVLTFDGLRYSLEYIVNPYTLAPNILKHILGFSVIFVSIGLSIFFIIKKIHKATPWIITLMLGMLYTIFTTIGRFNVRPPHMEYFIIMSTTTEIALLVLFSILFLESKKFRNKQIRQSIKIIFVLFIIFQISLLSATYVYYIDKIHDGYLEERKEKRYLCFDLPSNTNDSCFKFSMHSDPSRKFNKDPNSAESDIFTVINFFIFNKMAIFSNDDFFKQQQSERNLLIKDVNSKSNIFNVEGDIQTLNNEIIKNDSKIYLKENFVNLNGWVKSENNDITSLILFVDQIPFLSTNLITNQHTSESISDNNLFWEISFFPAYLEVGCHSLSVKGMNEDTLFIIDKNFTLCVESSKNYSPGELNPSTFNDIKTKIFAKFGIS